MAVNPYAPPKAEVADVVRGQVSPALWNPNAAANWSLLFSPAFGAFVQMKNWQALGEPAKASRSKGWAILSLVFFACLAIASAFLPDTKAVDGLSRLLAFVLLISWYFSCGRQQTAYVKARFGNGYPRRGWAKPLLFALLALVGFVVGAGVIGFAVGLFTGGV